MRVLTVNEQVGKTITLDDEGGAWLIKHIPTDGAGAYVTAVAGNRETATAIIENRLCEHPERRGEYEVEVWHIFTSVDEVEGEEED